MEDCTNDLAYYGVASVTNAKFFIEVALRKQGIKADFYFNTCLGQVFNNKLGYFDDVHVVISIDACTNL